VASATVVGPDLTLADAFATVVFILGIDGLAWIDDQPGYEAYVITHDQRTRWSPGFASYRRPPD
jgi:thiamine biosynthesis lipoprotein